MAQSIFVAYNTCSIDAEAPTSPMPNSGDVGLFLIGGAKAILRRALASFDLFGAALSGRALRAGDTITLAELLGYVLGATGPTFQVDAARLTRADYVAAEATWNNYRASSPWTAAGGDVAAPPAAASFTSPSALGDQVVQSNLAPFATDAVANRGGLALLRWRAQNEDPGVTALYQMAADPAFSPPLRLRITYLTTEPTPIDRPQPTTAVHHVATAAAPARPARASPSTRAAPPSRNQQPPNK